MLIGTRNRRCGSQSIIAFGKEQGQLGSPDGRRMQWLIGPEKSDPRVKPDAWIYKDGATVFVSAFPWRHGGKIAAFGFCAR